MYRIRGLRNNNTLAHPQTPGVGTNERFTEEHDRWRNTISLGGKKLIGKQDLDLAWLMPIWPVQSNKPTKQRLPKPELNRYVSPKQSKQVCEAI